VCVCVCAPKFVFLMRKTSIRQLFDVQLTLTLLHVTYMAQNARYSSLLCYACWSIKSNKCCLLLNFAGFCLILLVIIESLCYCQSVCIWFSCVVFWLSAVMQWHGWHQWFKCYAILSERAILQRVVLLSICVLRNLGTQQCLQYNTLMTLV